MPEMVTTLLTFIFAEILDIVNTIMSNPVLAFPVVIGFAGMLIGLSYVLLGRRRRRKGQFC